jgi:hypothetical protein
MSTFPVIDVVVALGFLYLLFALACTTLNEAIAGFFHRRSNTLKAGIEHLLGDKAMAEAIYRHPSIASLSRPGRMSSDKPSYIPSERFAAVLTDYLTGQHDVTDKDALAAGIAKAPPAASRQLSVLFQLANSDPKEFRARVATWYEENMDRVSGWYKRAVQRQTYLMAIGIVVVLNLDSVNLFNRLWSDSAFRASAVDQAKARIEATGTAEVPLMEYTEGDATDAGAPVQVGTVSLTDSERELLTSLRGWEEDRARLAGDIVRNGGGLGVRTAWLFGSIWSHLLGWLVTVLAISIGAPFWFDLLNKFVNLRSAGRATDEPRSKA